MQTEKNLMFVYQVALVQTIGVVYVFLKWCLVYSPLGIVKIENDSASDSSACLKLSPPLFSSISYQ